MRNYNKDIFSSVEFDSWANRKHLTPEERYLITTYFAKNGKTLEAGTASGRILSEMKEMGFSSLYGFDYVPAFIEQAKARHREDRLFFDVQDAAYLRYEPASFDQIVYLQQIVCFIEDDGLRYKALQEAYRVLKYGGIALFSFLNFDARASCFMYIPYLSWIKILRRVRKARINIQYLTRLKLGGKFHFGAVTDKGPYVYWYKTQEIDELLQNVGFQISAVGSSYQIEEGRMCQTLYALKNEPIKGMIYIVCRK